MNGTFNGIMTMSLKGQVIFQNDDTTNLTYDLIVMNNTCIHLRVKCPNIYMYRRKRIYKEPHVEIQ
jgi:hypothetical protein